MSIRYLQLLPLLLCLAGCGQTGALYLPEKAPPPDTGAPPPDESQAQEPVE